MTTVEEIIGDLLLRNNCVIVPSFGGFVTNQTSASIDYSNGTMLPPRKSVLFNRQLVSNDGLLVKEYANALKVDYSKAEDTVKSCVTFWNERLSSGERITIDRVGFIFLDAEKNICFEQDRFFNLLLESYGLGKVHFIPEEDVKIVEHIQQHAPVTFVDETSAFALESTQIDVVAIDSELKEVPVIQLPASKRKIAVWKYAAAAILIPIGFYSFWIPMKTNVLESGILSIKDFNPSYHATEGKYKPVNFTTSKINIKEEEPIETAVNRISSGSSSYAFKFSSDIYINVRLKDQSSQQNPELEQSSVSENVTEIAAPKVKQAPMVSKITYDLVVGCFGSTENADNLVNTLKAKGFAAKIVDKNGDLYRVSAGTTRSKEEILKISESLKATGLSGWILKK